MQIKHLDHQSAAKEQAPATECRNQIERSRFRDGFQIKAIDSDPAIFPMNALNLV